MPCHLLLWSEDRPTNWKGEGKKKKKWKLWQKCGGGCFGECTTPENLSSIKIDKYQYFEECGFEYQENKTTTSRSVIKENLTAVTMCG